MIRYNWRHEPIRRWGKTKSARKWHLVTMDGYWRARCGVRLLSRVCVTSVTPETTVTACIDCADRL